MPGTPAERPRRVGPYRVLSKLGSGGMGEVHLGRSPGGRPVAIKIVHPAMATDQRFRARFGREVTAARAVGGVYTAPVLDADPDAPLPWLATAYLRGKSLQQTVAEHGPLPAAAVRSLGAGLAEALISIHRAGIVHRDLKPSNVMLTPDGPRVIDFGIARAADASALTRTGAIVGTPAYMPPEQAAGTTVKEPGDVFSLAAVLTYAVTGRGPFGHGHIHEVIYRVLHLEPDLRAVTDLELRGLITECLDKDPDARPTPAEVLDRLTARDPAPHGLHWLPDPVARDIAEQPPVPATGPSRRTLLLIGAGGGDSPFRWMTKMPDGKSVFAGPDVFAGTLYAVATGGSRETTQTCAFDLRSGRLRWRAGFAAGTSSRPAVLDGTGFVCDGVGHPSTLTAFDTGTGRTLWTKQLPTSGNAVPLAVNGAVHLIDDSIPTSGLYAFDVPTGKQIWHYRTDAPVQGNAALSAGLLHIVDDDGFLHAIDLVNGRRRWRGRAEGVSRATPVVAGGLVVVASQDYDVYAFDAASGRRLWRVSLGEELNKSDEVVPVVVDGTVYVGAHSGVLYALDTRDGRVRWKFAAGNVAATGAGTDYLTPAVSGGLALLSNDSGELYALEAATGRTRWRATVGDGLGDRPVIAGNLVYQGSVTGISGFDLATGRRRYTLDRDSISQKMTPSAENMTGAGGTAYCAIGATAVCALRPPK